jgi:hypothetical protein
MDDNDPFREGLNDEQMGQYDMLEPLSKQFLVGILTEIPALGWDRALAFTQGLNGVQMGQYVALPPPSKQFFVRILTEIPSLGWNRALAFTQGLNGVQMGQYAMLGPLSKRLLAEILTDIPALGWNRALTFAQYFPRLALMDSIHDFWPERTRMAIPGQDANEDEDEVIDEDRMAVARGRLVGVIERYGLIQGYLDGGEESDIADLLSAITDDAVRSATSNFEPNVEKYLKTQIRELNPQVSRVSFDEILTKAPWNRTDGANWPTYQTAIKSLGDGVEIYPGGRRLKTMSEGERNKIGFFVLAYLNPEEQPGRVEAGQPEFTFDAAAKDVDKILGGLEQTYNAIFPQNIADSASTSFSALKGRAKYSPAHVNMPGVNEQIYRSNVYSANEFQLSIVHVVGAPPFGPKNRFGFGLKAKKLAGGAEATAMFGVRASQGPSVNYLIDLLTSGDAAAPPGKVLNLASFFDLMGEVGDDEAVEFDEDLLYDLKRTGDAEQVFRALIALLVEGRNISLVTIDRLCSVLARLLGLPTIFHTIKGFYVYRGEGGAALTPQENILRAAKFKAKELVEKLMILQTYTTVVSAAAGDIRRMKDHIAAIKDTSTVFSDPVALPDIGGLSSVWAEKSNEYAGTFAAALLRYRLENMFVWITTLEDQLTTVAEALDPAELATSIAGLQQFEAFQVGNVVDGRISSGGFNYSNFLALTSATIDSIAALQRFGLALDITTDDTGVRRLTREPLYVELTPPGTTRLKRGVKSTFYNFSAAPFGELQIAVGKLLRENRGRVNEKTIESSLRDYFRARDVIKEDFFDIQLDGSPAPMKDTFEEMTDITTGLTPSQSIGATAAAEGSQTLLDAIHQSLVVSPVPAVAVGGGRPVQVGGATSPYQWYDLDDLLFEISDKAYGFYQSALMEGGIHDHRDLAEYLDVFRPLVDEIQSQWLQTIADLRLRAVEEYPRILWAPAVFEETDTTYLISYILSFRSDGPADGYRPMYGTPTAAGTTVPEYMFGGEYEYSRRNRTVYEDVAFRLMIGAIPEVKILYFLTRIRMRYDEEGRVNARDQWLRLGPENFLKFLMGFGSFPDPMAQPMAKKAPKSGRTYYAAKAKADAEKALAKLNKLIPLSPYESNLARNAIFAKQSRGQELTTREKDFAGRPKVGGLRERRSLYSNASEPHALPVRPPSDEGLRERRRTRRAPRVRQSTRKSRRRGQRDDLDRV